MTLLLLFSGGFVAPTPDGYRNIANYASPGTGPKLYAARVSKTGAIYETFPDPASVGVRWSLPGGVQRIEVTVRPRHKNEAFNRTLYNLGDQIVLYDSYLDKPIVSAWIYSGRYEGQSVVYSGGGDWKRHADQAVKTAPTPADDTDVYLKDTVLAAVFAGNMSTDNIMATGVAIGNYEVDELRGVYPQKIIERILEMGDSDANVLDYWTSTQRFTPGGAVDYPMANLQPRISDTPSWRITMADLAGNSLERSAWKMRNQVDIYYGPTTALTNDIAGGVSSIVVNNASIIQQEYTIEITLDSGKKHRSAVDAVSGSSVGLVTKIPGTGTNPIASAGNLVRVVDPLTAVSAADTIAGDTYWEAEFSDERPTFNQGAAQNYADAYLSALAYPVSETSFSIGGPYVSDYHHQRWPLWRMLANPGIIEISDLLPDASLLAEHLDGLRSFRIVALDYDHKSRTMRVTPDAYQGEQRLDVLLQQLGAPVGQMVNRS